MERIRRSLPAVVIGLLLGVAGAHAFTGATRKPSGPVDGTVWTPHHAAIQAQALEEPSPTF
jgi:hypothetical protein